MINEELITHNVLAACDKHELRGAEKDAVLKWLHEALVINGLLSNLEKGHVEITGLNSSKDDVMFALTESGKEIANDLC
jgi:hypothetical protein